MHKYEYMDADGDTLRIMTGYTKGQTVVQIDQNRRLMGVNVLNEDVVTVAANLLKAAGQECVIIPKGPIESIINAVIEGGLVDKFNEVEAEKKLQERRDALSLQLNGEGEGGLQIPYARRTAPMRQAINRIIELEDGK